MTSAGMQAVEAAAQAGFEALARASLQGGAAIVFVWLACRLLPGTPPRIQCWLWRAACLKLVLALVWATPVDLPLLAAGERDRGPVAAPAAVSNAAAVSFAARPGQRSAPHRVSEPRPAAARPRAADRHRPGAVFWVMLVWATGAVGGAVQMLRDGRAARRLRELCVPLDDPRLVDLLGRLARQARLPAPPRLLAGPGIRGPLLVGGRVPGIILPEALAASGPLEPIRLVLAHEVAHLARRDLAWGWLPAIAQALFFFHPGVWAARRECWLAQEMACDAAAVELTGAPAAEYGAMLLAVATRAARGLASACPAGGPAAGIRTESVHGNRLLGAADGSPRALRRRLEMLRRYSFPGRRGGRVLIAALLVTGGGICLPSWRLTAAADGGAAARSPGGAAAAGARPGQPPAAGKPEEAWVPGPAAGGTRGSDDPGRQPALAEQWEDVLLLEAMRYLRLTPAQVEQLLPTARAAATKLASLAEQEARTRAALAAIARQNREALLAGRPGVKQSDALLLERGMRGRRTQAEKQIVDYVLPRLGAVLTREQMVRACLLTLGEPPRDRDHAVSAALLDPGAGFVLGRVEAEPPADPAEAVRERVAKIRSRWEEQRNGTVRELLARRYPPDVINQLLAGDVLKTPEVNLWLNEPLNLQASRIYWAEGGAERLLVTPEGDPGGQDPRVQAARNDYRALLARSKATLAEMLLASGERDELLGALRPFSRRMFLSPRLETMLEERRPRK